MPQLTSTVSGVVVSVSEETASRLSTEWVPVEPKRGPGRPKKSEEID